MKVAQHSGVVMYILAACAAISALLALAANPGLAANLFPQPTPWDVAEAAQWLCCGSPAQPQALPDRAGKTVASRPIGH